MLKLTVLFVRLVWTVHVSVTELAAADTLATIRAGLFPSGAVRERSTGRGTDGGEALATFTCVTSRIGQAQVGTSAVVVGAAVSSWRKWVKRIIKLRKTKPLPSLGVNQSDSLSHLVTA